MCPSFRRAHVLLNNSDQTLACGTHPALCKAFLHSQQLLETEHESRLPASLECASSSSLFVVTRLSLVQGIWAPLIRVGGFGSKINVCSTKFGRCCLLRKVACVDKMVMKVCVGG